MTPQKTMEIGFDGILYRLLRCKKPLSRRKVTDFDGNEGTDGEVPKAY
jgi:hypothetical protein